MECWGEKRIAEILISVEVTRRDRDALSGLIGRGWKATPSAPESRRDQ
jgi:hypothetical protein